MGIYEASVSHPNSSGTRDEYSWSNPFNKSISTGTVLNYQNISLLIRSLWKTVDVPHRFINEANIYNLLNKREANSVYCIFGTTKH